MSDPISLLLKADGAQFDSMASDASTDRAGGVQWRDPSTDSDQNARAESAALAAQLQSPSGCKAGTSRPGNTQEADAICKEKRNRWHSPFIVLDRCNPVVTSTEVRPH